MATKKLPAANAAKPDLAAIRAQAEQERQNARAKMAAAKREAEFQKAELSKPPPVYVNMPQHTGNAEADSLADLNELQKGFEKRRADEEARFNRTVDGEFWGCLCFRTHEQKDAFFAALAGGVLDLSIGSRYFDGNAVAERLGIELPESGPAPKLKPADKSWTDRVRADAATPRRR